MPTTHFYHLRQFGIINNAHSAYGFISECFFHLFHAICSQVHPLLTSPGIKVKGSFVDEGGRNKDESLYVFPSPATYFNLLYPTLPTQVKVKR